MRRRIGDRPPGRRRGRPGPAGTLVGFAATRRGHWLRAAIGLLAACLIGTQAPAMWVQMSVAELIRGSNLIVVGEWLGQAPLHLSKDRAAVAVSVIVVHQVLKGPQGTDIVFVAGLGARQPVSSTDLHFERGDRGIWFLRLRDPLDAAGPYVVDHPQRFLRDVPGNAEAIAAMRRQLQGR